MHKDQTHPVEIPADKSLVKPSRRADERDIMFARMTYQKGSPQFEDYYRMRPQNLEVDESIREMPGPFEVGTATFHPHVTPFAEAGFALLARMKHLDQNPKKSPALDVLSIEMTGQIKAMASFLGVQACEVVNLALDEMYSHKGRGQDYGKPIESCLPRGIMLLIEMDKDFVNRAPQLEQGTEAVKAYMNLATASLWLATYIQQLGYEAKVHIDGNYEAFLPPLAEKAGLGEVGRASLLINPEYGQRIRLAMISTDLPLEISAPKALGIKAFCQACGRCATTCPGKAISKEPAQYLEDRDLIGWTIDQESCFKVWRRVGMDCGVCLSSCPVSQGLTSEEWQLISDGDAAAAYGLYQERQPLRVYHKELMPFVHYPKAPVVF